MEAFTLRDVLSVTTERALWKDDMRGVLDLLSHIMGTEICELHAPVVKNPCKEHLLKKNPRFAAITGDEITPENIEEWVAQQEKRFGKIVIVEPISMNFSYAEPPATFLELKEILK